jgi:hypothetical protein
MSKGVLLGGLADETVQVIVPHWLKSETWHLMYLLKQMYGKAQKPAAVFAWLDL